MQTRQKDAAAADPPRSRRRKDAGAAGGSGRSAVAASGGGGGDDEPAGGRWAIVCGYDVLTNEAVNAATSLLTGAVVMYAAVAALVVAAP